LACIIRDIIDYKGEIKYDSSKPDGTSRKLLDITRLKTLGWLATTTLEEGIKKSYDWYLNNHADMKN